MSKLKNYTSQVPASRSMAKIENMLVQVGAKNINKEYVGEKITAFYFLVDVEGTSRLFKLPVKTNSIYKVLEKEVKRPSENTYKNIEAQSERTAWKIICDWVEIQCTLIKLEQVELSQVFLPYVYDPNSNTTLWEQVKEGSVKLLGE